ncbi:MAG: NAD(P)/FAD-dependent oxidoreductase [Thermoplasmata archaeon]|nr:NAD(P)/FAD-dependent oxidoreductase [Thermoplasmata archaeon]
MEAYDVAVIGAGVVGSFVARDLSRYDLRTVVLEAGPDAASGASRGNSGVVHAGFFSVPSTLKAEMCVSGSRMYEGICRDLGVPFSRCGKIVTVHSGAESEMDRLERLLVYGEASGIGDLRIVDGGEARSIEPGIDCRAALVSPSSAIVSPYETTIAAAEDACVNGVRFMLGARVSSASREGPPEDPAHIITAGDGRSVRARAVVNAAGLSSGRVAAMFGLEGFTVHPCRGEYLLLDKAVGGLINGMVYPLAPEGESTLGVHLTPTVAGHILVGPTVEFIGEASAATTASRHAEMLAAAHALLPPISKRHVIKAFAGLRAKLVPEGGTTAYGDVDFAVEESPAGVVHLLGIESPGLTAAPALAGWVVPMLLSHLGGADLKGPTDVVRYRWPYTTPPATAGDRALGERAVMAAADPDRGAVVCRCEHVTRADILRALDNPLGAKGLDAVKFRTRARMGRCQGGFCLPRIADILVDERDLHPSSVRMSSAGSEPFAGWVKEGGAGR